jgi:hypothetical protein
VVQCGAGLLKEDDNYRRYGVEQDGRRRSPVLRAVQCGDANNTTTF